MSDPSGPASSKPKYGMGDKCFAREGPLIYEAQIRKVLAPNSTSIDSQWQYFIHYQGWNVKWDKWVTQGSLLPDNDETREIAKRAKEQAKRTKASSKKVKGGKGADVEAEDSAKRKKEKKDPADATVDEEAILRIKRARYLANNSLTGSYDPSAMGEGEGETAAGGDGDGDGADGGEGKKSAKEGGTRVDPRGVLRPILPFPLKKLLVDDWSSCTASR